jgi:hypothetical protein
MEEWYRQLLEETLWFTDKGTPNSNGEVIFRASVDDGATFGNKTNPSNPNY